MARPPARFSPVEMIAMLVGFDTTSHLSNRPLVEFVRDYLSAHGVASTLVPTEDGTKAALYSTLGDDKPGGIVLSGHTDVVPVAGQSWSSDPFTLVERDGKLFGRGSCDMKGFLGVALALVPDFLAQGLSRPIHLALSYDEEVGCLGVRPLIEQMRGKIAPPEAVVVGEPTNMTVVNAHKSINGFITEVHGSEAHSSMPELGVNAVMIACEMVGWLRAMAEEMRSRGDPSGRFEPGATTVHVGTIEGGTALNIVPKHCRFHWEFRGLPDQDPEEIPARLDQFVSEKLLPGMHRINPDADIVIRQINDVPVFSGHHGSPAELLALNLAQQNETLAVSYGTEAGLFEMADMATIVCGPGHVEQAHKPDEFVTLDQVRRCEEFLRRLMAHLA